MRLMKEHSIDADELSFSAEHLAKLIQMVDAKAINSNVAKEVFEKIFTDDIEPEEVIANNPKAIEDFRGGKEKALGALVGQTMKAMKGKADPASVNQMLRELLK